jgi:hypothetical protein
MKGYKKIASTKIICSGQARKSCLPVRKIVVLTLTIWEYGWDLNPHTMGMLAGLYLQGEWFSVNVTATHGQLEHA